MHAFSSLFSMVSRGLLLSLLLGAVACAGPLERLQRSSHLKATGASAGPSNYRAYSNYLQALDAERYGDLDSAEQLLRRARELDPGAAGILVRLGRVRAQQQDFSEAISLTRQAILLEPESRTANFQLASLLQYNNQLGEAESTYQKVLRIDPENESAVLELANLYRAQGKPEEGLALLEQFEASGGAPGVQSLMLMAALHKDAGEVEKAEQELLAVLDMYPEFPQAQRALLDLYLANGNQREVAARLEALLQAQPWQTWIPDSLIGIYARLGDLAGIQRILDDVDGPDEQTLERLRLTAVEELAGRRSWEQALRILEPMLKSGPDNQQASYYAGYLYSRQKDYPNALKYYEQIGADSTFYARALEQRALALQAMGRTDEAARLLTGYLEQEPDEEDLRFTLIAIFLRSDRLDEALAVCDALELHLPNNPEVAVQRAFVLHEMKRSDEAIAGLQAAIARQPSQLRLYEVQAAILGDIDRMLDAIEVLKEALKVQPENESLRFSLGGYYDRLKLYDDAIAQMFKILEQNKNSSEAMNFIGYTWAELGIRLPEAETLIRRALELDPDNGYITDSLGWVYYKNQNFSEAVKMLERAVELTTDEPVIVEHLGDAYLKVGRAADALRMYRRAAEEIQRQERPIPEEKARILQKFAEQQELQSKGAP